MTGFSLDLLQVAAAMILGAEIFVTFDAKQGRLAKAAGLVVLTAPSAR